MISSTPDAPSHSRLACLAHCERKYFYNYHVGYKGKQLFAPMHAGSAGHVGLEAWHRLSNRDAVSEAMHQAWSSHRFHGDFEYLTPGHLECVLGNYMESKHTQGWQPVRLRRSDLVQEALLITDAVEDADGYLVLAEASFVINVPDLGPINMRPDLLLEQFGGRLCIVDHKFTTGWLGSKLYTRAKFEHQLRLYALGMSTLIGRPVESGLVNGIFMGEKAAQPAFKGQRFEPYSFDYTPADFEETKAWYIAGRLRMQHIAEHYSLADEMQAQQNPGEHCGRCDYSLLCSTVPAMRPIEIKKSFTRRTS